MTPPASPVTRSPPGLLKAVCRQLWFNDFKNSERPARLTMNDSDCVQARCVIAMAASVGGLDALSAILSGVPADFPAAIAIVMHVSPEHKSLLPDILSWRTHLEVKEARDGDILCHSSVFVAPPNHHLSVAEGGILKLSSPSASKGSLCPPVSRAPICICSFGL